MNARVRSPGCFGRFRGMIFFLRRAIDRFPFPAPNRISCVVHSHVVRVRSSTNRRSQPGSVPCREIMKLTRASLQNDVKSGSPPPGPEI